MFNVLILIQPAENQFQQILNRARVGNLEQPTLLVGMKGSGADLRHASAPDLVVYQPEWQI